MIPSCVSASDASASPTSSEGEAYFDEREFETRADREDRHFWARHRREILRRELDAFLPARGVPLIELGCGVGSMATYLNQHGFRVDYSDFFPRALEHARARAARALGPAAEARSFVAADLTKPLPPLEQRGALLLDVIEHLPDDVEVLRNVRAALPDAPDAFVMVTVPAFEFLWSPWDDIEKHKRRYTAGSLARALEAAGFAAQRLTFFFAPLFFAALGVKALRAARDRVLGPPPPPDISNLAEFRELGRMNDVVRGVLALETPFVTRRSVPVGTSLLAIARRA